MWIWSHSRFLCHILCVFVVFYTLLGLGVFQFNFPLVHLSLTICPAVCGFSRAIPSLGISFLTAIEGGDGIKLLLL